MKKLIKIIFFLVIAGNGIANAQDRDPFAPYTNSAPVTAVAGSSESKPNHSDPGNPLTDKPISSYTVIGVAISPNDALAVLKARDKHDYFAYIGDKVGSEGGTIETIDTEGITVNMNEKIIPLKVSNRFEMHDEKQTDETK